MVGWLSCAMKSWQTTTFGILGAVGSAVALVEGLPAWVYPVGKLLTALGVAGLGMAARDHDKSSEDAGIKPKQ